MQNKLLPVLLTAAALVTCSARAQDTGTANQTVLQPTIMQPTAQSPAPAAATAANQSLPAPDQTVYAPRLPTVPELANAASAQGLSIVQIVQTSTQITAVYRSANGQTTTVAYQLLPGATASDTTTTAATTTVMAPSTTVVVPNQAPTVIYETTPNVIYYDSYRSYPSYYYPYYPPVSLSLGFGYYRGWGGGGHGGFHHGR